MHKSSVTRPPISLHDPLYHVEVSAANTSSTKSHDKLLLESVHHLKLNHILAALPLAELESFSLDLQLVYLPVGLMIYEQCQKSRYVYFPLTCVVSLLHVMESGKSSETAGGRKRGYGWCCAIFGWQ